MEHSKFRIGGEFWCGDNKWRCTDVGSRVIAAICLSSDEVIADPSWLNGPPYALAESVFDEYDIEGCSIEPEDESDEAMASKHKQGASTSES